MRGLFAAHNEICVEEGGRTVRLTGYWRVVAGVIPGDAMPEYNRQFLYTSDLYEQDRDASDFQATRFAALMKEAHEDAMSIPHPSRLPWVQVEFVWI